MFRRTLIPIRRFSQKVNKPKMSGENIYAFGSAITTVVLTPFIVYHNFQDFSIDGKPNIMDCVIISGYSCMFSLAAGAVWPIFAPAIPLYLITRIKTEN